MGGNRQEEGFKTIDDIFDIIWLLKTIRDVMFKLESMKDHYLSMIDARLSPDHLYQDRQE